MSRVGFAKCISVTISKEKTRAPIWIPHISYTEGYDDSFHSRDRSFARVHYLASRRNHAMEQLVESYPDATHALMIDSYYLDQHSELRALIKDYQAYYDDRPQFSGLIMGGSTWFRSYLWPYRRDLFWDTWTTPELRSLPKSVNKVIKVNAVGCVILFPISEWIAHPFDSFAFPDGCEFNSFCSKSTLPILMNTYRKFDHPNPERYSFIKSMRVHAGFHLRNHVAQK